MTDETLPAVAAVPTSAETPVAPVAPVAVAPPATPADATATPAAPTHRVRIDAGGREVELETTEASAGMEALALTALALWKATGGEVHPAHNRSLFGLVASERATTRGPSSAMDVPMDVPQ